MGEVKHTPGPWKIDFGYPRGFPGGISAKSDGKPVTRFGALARPSTPEALANARLIAAAPDLLEDAERRVRECEPCRGSGRARKPHGFFNIEVDCPACSATRTAIARATQSPATEGGEGA